MNHSLAKKFGKILRHLRQEMELSQEALALRADLDRTYISLLERGLRQPTLDTLFRLSRQLKTLPSAIVKRVE